MNVLNSLLQSLASRIQIIITNKKVNINVNVKMKITFKGTQSSDQQPHSQTNNSLVTEFSKEMFSPHEMKLEETEGAAENISYGYDVFKSEMSSPSQHFSSPTHQMSTG